MKFKTTALSHQQRVFNETSHLAVHALLWEQGTGKTKPTIDMFAAQYLAGEVDALIVVAPGGVERNWKSDELPKHLPDEVAAGARVEVWQTKRAGTKWHASLFEGLLRHKGPAILLVSYDAFMTDKCKNYIWKFLRQRRCFYVLDEAHNIKTPGAKRTKSIVASGRYAPYKRILTGTPISVGPFDVYSQIKFLDENFWKKHGFETFSVFKRHFGVWFTAAECQQLHGYDPGFDKLIEYRNLDELQAILKTISDRVLKTDVLDLPPKLYSKRYFEMTSLQTSMYDELKREYEVELEDGAVVDGALAIVRLLRLQQITCGYVKTDVEDEPVRMIGNTNPRLECAEELLKNLHHPAIVWTRFSKDVDQLMDILGKGAVRYDGRISEDEAERSKLAFQGGEAQWFVGNPAKGSAGLTLNQAKTTVYYNNSFKLIERLQSEDRNHRFGQDNAVHYIDIQAPSTVDEHITRALRGHLDIASQITGDKLREWI